MLSQSNMSYKEKHFCQIELRVRMYQKSVSDVVVVGLQTDGTMYKLSMCLD